MIRPKNEADTFDTSSEKQRKKALIIKDSRIKLITQSSHMRHTTYMGSIRYDVFVWCHFNVRSESTHTGRKS